MSDDLDEDLMDGEDEQDEQDKGSGKKFECTICKHIGQKTNGKLERAQLFDEVGTPISIQLCRNHSVELFKFGQKKFLINHHKILTDIISSDETKFLDILEKTIRGNINEIY